MWYAIVDAASVGLILEPEYGTKIARFGEMIKVATREQHPVQVQLFEHGLRHGFNPFHCIPL